MAKDKSKDIGLVKQIRKVVFWGQWDSQSKFELTDNPYSLQPSLPHAVHKPLFSTHGIGTRDVSFIPPDFIPVTRLDPGLGGNLQKI